MLKKSKIFFLYSAILAGLVFAGCTTTKGLSEGNGPDLDYYGNGFGSQKRYKGDISDPSSIAYFEQNFGNKIYFGTNEHELDQKSIDLVNDQTDWLSSNRYKITIEGHCDERGTREHNIALGERRAFEVKKHFMQNGISPSRISVVSYGKEKPESFGGDEESWALNRRAVIVLE